LREGKVFKLESRCSELNISRGGQGRTSTYIGAAIGVLYAVAGLLILSMKRRAAMLGIVLLIAVIVGRIGMLVTGLYPVDKFKQILAIILGTTIVAVFAIYIGLKWSSFS